MTTEEAFLHKYSNISIEAKGKVIEILTDDEKGEPHQRFIIESHPGHTILIINNIEHGYKMPVKLDDILEVKGTYVWNRYGGLIHETHHHQEGEAHVDGYISLIHSKKNG
jgi:hypothetical protein